MLIHDITLLVSATKAGLDSLGDGKFALHVPPGMETLAPRKAFAMLYKTFCVFRHTMRKRERLATLDGVEPDAAAGFGADQAGHYAFRDALGLDELFEQTDEMRLLTLLQARGRSATDVHARIHRHLHLALFDEDGAPYLERVPGPRRELRYDSSDIVGLYCFVAEDFYRHLLDVDITAAWGRFADEGLALAADFRHRYLHDGASLHNGEREACDRTLDRLRHTLQIIDRRTPFRPPTYRVLYEALDRYLHGGLDQQASGMVWGVQDFWAVWESVCLVHAMSNRSAHCLTCDFEHLPHAVATAADRIRWQNERTALFARNEYERRPDLVLVGDDQATIVDFKCYTAPPASRPKETNGDIDKQERDFLNIEAYGLMLQNHFLKTSSPLADRMMMEFWLPGIAHRRTACANEPPWNPPLSFVTLPTAELVEAYVKLYRGG